MRCQICNAAIKNSAEEQEHLKLHAGFDSNKPKNLQPPDKDNGDFCSNLGDFIPLQKQLECTKCNLGFSNIQQLKNHERIHNKPLIKKQKFNCLKCKVEFSKYQFLKDHEIRVHNNKKPQKKQKQLKKAAKKAAAIKQRDKQCLIIRGYTFDPDDTEAVNYFSKYGKIILFNVFDDYVEVTYEDAESAKRTIMRKHVWKGHLLDVRYRRLDINPVAANDKTNLVSQLGCVTDIKQQFEILKFVLLTSHRKESDEKLQTLGSDLEATIKQYKPDCNVYLYGSATTKLNFVASRVDIYIDLKVNNPSELLKNVKTIMDQSNKFDNVVVKSETKLPSIKFKHIPTKLNGDINVSYPLAVCNSKLIRNILDIDEKLRNVMLFLKYFFKRQLIIQRDKFNNYTMCILFIFYLQSFQKLPPISEFSKMGLYKRIFNGWNGGLDPFDPNVYKGNFTNLTYLDLVKGFFSFYGSFDYKSYAICPFVGRAIKRTDLLTVKELPDSYVYYKNGGPNMRMHPATAQTDICIQDPFEHNRNIAVDINQSTLIMFIQTCRLASSKCNTEQCLLYKLFKIESEKQVVSIDLTNVPDYTFLLQKSTIFNYLDKTRPVGEAWLKVVCEFTKMVLEDFLKIEISELDEEPHPMEKINKWTRVSLIPQEDIYDRPGKIALQCLARVNLWGGRKKNISNDILKQLNNLNFIQKELKITEMLLKQHPKNSNAEVLFFGLIIDCKDSGDKAYFNMEKYLPASNRDKFNNTYKRFKVFFSEKMPMWFHQYEKYLSEQQRANI